MPDKNFNKCIMSEDKETCLTHNCNAYDHCMKPGCPHCDLPQNRYHVNMDLSNSYLRAKDRGEVE